MRARTWRWTSTRGRRGVRGAACKCLRGGGGGRVPPESSLWGGGGEGVGQASGVEGRPVTQGWRGLEQEVTRAGQADLALGSAGRGGGGCLHWFLRARGGACRGEVACTLLSAWSQRGGLAAVSRRT